MAGIAVLSSLILGFGLFTWWLYLSPMPSGPAQVVTRPPGLRQLIVLLVIVSGLMLITGAFWDEVWHRRYGIGAAINDFLWRPHQMIYASMALTNLIAFGGLFLTLRGGGDLRRRFRSEPLIGLLGLVAGYLALSAPSDLIWHQIYGLDITAWSLPHLLLAGGSTLVMLVTVALQFSQLPRGEWRGLRGLRWEEWLTVLLTALGMNLSMVILVSEWEGHTAIGGLGVRGLHMDAFWRRPEWLYPVVVVSAAIFFGTFIVHALRRAGAATLLMLVVLAIRALYFTVFGIWSATDIHMGLASQLLLLPPALALDVWYAARLRQAEAHVTLLGGNLLAAVVFLACGLPAVPLMLVYPRINGQTLPGMLGFGVVMALWSGWVGARLGAWLGALDRRAEAAQAVSPRLIWVGVGALTVVLAFAAIFILTARPPLI